MNKLRSIIPYIYNDMINLVRDADDLETYSKNLRSTTEDGDVEWYEKIFKNELWKMEKQIEILKENRNFVFEFNYQTATDWFNSRIEYLKECYLKEKKLKSWNKIKKFDYELWVRLIENNNDDFDLLDYIMDGSEYSDKILDELEFIENKNNHKFILEYIKTTTK